MNSLAEIKISQLFLHRSVSNHTNMGFNTKVSCNKGHNPTIEHTKERIWRQIKKIITTQFIKSQLNESIKNTIEQFND